MVLTLRACVRGWSLLPPSQEDMRVLAHFYTMEHFMDPELDKFIKRFVRNYIHYRDEVFCAAGRIIAAMEFAGGPTGFKALHIRRGDLQVRGGVWGDG